MDDAASRIEGVAAPDRAPRRAVTAFFDDRAAAQAAVDDLTAAGIARDAITLVEGGADPVAVAPVPSRDRSLWDRIKDLLMADEDRHAYGEGLSRGGFLLSVATGAADHARVVDLLDREGAVDMDARQSDWALEGWDPARASSDLRAAADLASSPAAPLASAAARDAGTEGRRFRSYVESPTRSGPAG